MTADEWLAIGYEKGLIADAAAERSLSFGSAYGQWFLTRLNRGKKQSHDRIEVTYRKYYENTDFNLSPVHTINESVIYSFLNDILIRYGNITRKEYYRIYQIVNNVMDYCSDLRIGGAKDINWDVVKRYIAVDSLVSSNKKEYSIPMPDKQLLFRKVLYEHIYPYKQCTCMCLLLNFYLGLRVGELAGLKWTDVHLEKGYIEVHSTEVKYFERDGDGRRTGTIRYVMQDGTKTVNGMRLIPLVNESIYLINLIKQYQADHGYDTEYLVYDGLDSIATRSIERCLRRLCGLCGIPCINTHLIRKTLAVDLHASGVPTKIISDLLGHSEIKTTEKFYIISSSESMEIVRNALANSCIVKL